MGRYLTAEDVESSLSRHDPLSAWDPQHSTSRDYASAAASASLALRRVQGLGHIATVIADSVDRLHPGFYEAYRRRDPGVVGPVNRVARELWDIHGILPGRATEPPISESADTVRPGEGVPAGAPSAAEIAQDPQLLVDWLRDVEALLSQVPAGSSTIQSPGGELLRRELPALIDGYPDLDAASREAVRDAFARFRLVLYHVSMFAGSQYSAMSTSDPLVALRRALLAESVLDLGLDWRDELLMLRDLRRDAEARGLPFASEVEKVAACSSEATAEFLRGVCKAG
jgi:hypothetical protein